MSEKLERYAGVLIVGNTGTGKSSCLRNVPNPERVLVLNTEKKMLPTRNAMKLKNVEVKTYTSFMKALDKAMLSEDYDIVFIDSHSAVIKMIQRYCEVEFKGFDVWSNYNNMIDKFHEAIKDNTKPLFITALPEIREGQGFEASKSFARVKAKEHKFGGVESNFTVVAWTHVEQTEDGMRFKLQVNPNMENTAKAPDEMFDGLVDNDIMKLIEAQDVYYGG